MNTSLNKLEVRGLAKSFDEPVLEDINLTLKEGEIVSLLGISGSGKTTIFNIIAGLLPPDAGEVLLNGIPITGQAGKVSYMLQKDLLLEHMTIEDNVALPLFLRGIPKEEARKKARSLFPVFALQGTEKFYPKELSGGMAQRAALLRTYLFSEEVALLDEPFSALDAITKDAVHRWYLDVMDKIGLSTIFVTHDIDEAIKLSQRIYVLAGRPSSIVGEFVVPKGLCRGEDYFAQPEFLQLKKDVLRRLRPS